MSLPAKNIFLSIGESMLEFSRGENDAWRLGFAGDTLNTAWYFRMSAPAQTWDVAYFTRLGADPYSRRMAAFLAENGIATHWIEYDADRQPGLYLIDTDNGERSFTYWRGQSAARHLADDEQRLAAALASADATYFSGITLAILSAPARQTLLRNLEVVRAAGKLVAFDPNIRPRLWEDAAAMRETLMAAAAISSIVLPTFDDERACFGDASPSDTARRYAAAGIPEIVVKNGGGDIVALADGDLQTIAGLKKVTPVDTTGAGDSFNGAYLAARAGGANVETAIRQAHALASRVVLHRGALMPLPKS